MSSWPTEPGGPVERPAGEARTVEVTLPELGNHALEAVVVAWERHPGDWVEADDPICIVSANGARAAVASSASGYLLRLLAGVGTRVAPGMSLAEIASEGVPRMPGPPDVPESALAPAPLEMASFHSPAVRRLATEHGVELSMISGTGSGGRISREDVLAHLRGARGDERVSEPATGGAEQT